MSLIERGKEKKIIEKKIILKKKNKSLSQDSSITNNRIPPINNLSSKIPNDSVNNNNLLNISKDINVAKNNIQNGTIYLSKKLIMKSDNKPYIPKTGNYINFNMKQNTYLHTPIKENYKNNSNTKNKSTEISSNFVDTKPKNDIDEYTNKVKSIHCIKLNPTSTLYRNKRGPYSCYVNKKEKTIKKENYITKFDFIPKVMESNAIYYNKNQTHCSDFENDKSYFDLYYCDSTGEKKMNNKINLENIFIELNKNNELNTVDEKIEFKNHKHVFVHKRRLSSFLINNQNNSKLKDEDKEKENNESKKSKYIYKKSIKSFSCINLKQKINNERNNISKSKRKSKIIDLNSNEFVFKEKDVHKGGKISLFNNISKPKFPSDIDINNNESEFMNININNLKSVIKIQRWIKNHFAIKKIILIQKAFRKYCLVKSNNNKNLAIKNYRNTKCEFITKKYKSKNHGFLKKIIFFQKYYKLHLLKKKAKFKNGLNSSCCYISKIRKSKKIMIYIILLQRKFREFLKIKKSRYNNSYFKNFGHKKNKKNIPHSHQRNKDLCNVDSYTNSSFLNIANESESNHKKIIAINKNDSIKTLYLNYKMNQEITNFQYCQKNDDNMINKENNLNDISQKSSYNEEFYNDEKFHNLPKNAFLKKHNFNKNDYDRYNEETINQDEDNGKDIYLISPFYSLKNEKENPKSKIIDNNNNLKIKEWFFKNIHKKFIFFFKVINRRFYLINFINMLVQRLLKNINQFVFFSLMNKYFSININIKENIFFNTIKRLKSLKGVSIPKEVKNLIDENIPIFLNKKKNSYFFSYIKPQNEENIIEIQLFHDNEWQFLNFIQYFLKEEKNKILNKVVINNYLTKNKIYNRNIFTIIRYIDSLADNLANIYSGKSKNLNLINMKEQKAPKYNYLEKFCCLNSYQNNMQNKNNINKNDELLNVDDKSKNKINVAGNIKIINNESNNKKYKRRTDIFFNKISFGYNDFWNEDDIFISNNKIIKESSLKRYINKK